VRDKDGDHAVSHGTIVYVAPNEEHGFFNRGDEVLRFICLIPHQG